jgi:hypothetical protein
MYIYIRSDIDIDIYSIIYIITVCFKIYVGWIAVFFKVGLRLV